jgi:tetratricopeptide (TPR) repeat protein
MIRRSSILTLAALAACTPARVQEEPVLEPGDRVATADASVAAVRGRTALARTEAEGRRDALAAEALTSCAPEVCAAIARGEVMLGMSEAQVLATTGTTEGAWRVRDAGAATLMVPASHSAAVRDATGELAMLQLQNGLVTTYSYREPQGVRVVSRPQDATSEGRASAMAEQLAREADDYVARGELGAALDRYDRAAILRPDDAMLDYRIASILDRQLRPVEALIRYQLFLHKLELEKIEARGQAWAYMAEAIAHARERVIVLEKRAP